MDVHGLRGCQQDEQDNSSAAHDHKLIHDSIRHFAGGVRDGLVGSTMLLAEKALRLADIVLDQARISFGTDVPELLSLSAQVIICA